MGSNDPDVGLTVADLARSQLHGLADALGVGEERRAVVTHAFDGIVAHCGDQPISSPPRWSGMTDDCSPIEWSVAFRRGEPDIRVLVEAQADPPSLAAYSAAATALTSWLVLNLGADDAMVSGVVDGFAPRSADAPAAAYHGVEFLHGGGIRSKVYLAPGAAGDPWAVAGAALAGLGLGPTLAALVDAVGPLDLPLVAFDLEPTERARVKLYLRSRSIDVFERVVAQCAQPNVDDLRPAIVSLYGEEVLARPPYVAVHLDASGSNGAAPPTRAVFSLPVYELGRGGDRAADRIANLLCHHGLDVAGYRRAVDALTAVASPGAGSMGGALGLHSWVSMQREPDGAPRVTVYFRVRAFAPRYGWLALDPDRTWPSAVR